ncbi:hypothetical protein Ciccas_012622 [Cichlidogyrus casuarinus]|uniref:Uncharacterized protein n=1 Tax=Cichlidogyrus casuarinus TaxID=1844966 RepID=A0ABD2PSW5_9PLAT
MRILNVDFTEPANITVKRPGWIEDSTIPLRDLSKVANGQEILNALLARFCCVFNEVLMENNRHHNNNHPQFEKKQKLDVSKKCNRRNSVMPKSVSFYGVPTTLSDFKVISSLFKSDVSQTFSTYQRLARPPKASLVTFNSQADAQNVLANREDLPNSITVNPYLFPDPSTKSRYFSANYPP